MHEPNTIIMPLVYRRNFSWYFENQFNKIYTAIYLFSLHTKTTIHSIFRPIFPYDLSSSYIAQYLLFLK